MARVRATFANFDGFAYCHGMSTVVATRIPQSFVARGIAVWPLTVLELRTLGAPCAA